LGAARLRGIDRLIILKRPAVMHITVADREAESGQIAMERRRQAQRRDPEPHLGSRNAEVGTRNLVGGYRYVWADIKVNSAFRIPRSPLIRGVQRHRAARW